MDEGEQFFGIARLEHGANGGICPTTFSCPIRVLPWVIIAAVPSLISVRKVSSSLPYTQMSLVNGGHMPPPPVPPWQALQPAEK